MVLDWITEKGAILVIYFGKINLSSAWNKILTLRWRVGSERVAKINSFNYWAPTILDIVLGTGNTLYYKNNNSPFFSWI